MKFEYKKTTALEKNLDAQVVFVQQQTKVESKAAKAAKGSKNDKSVLAKTRSPFLVLGAPSQAAEKLEQYADSADAIKGVVGDTVLFRDSHLDGARHLVAVGSKRPASPFVGAADDATTAEDIRVAMAHGTSVLKSLKAKTVAIHLDGLLNFKLDPYQLGRALSEALLMTSYQFTDFKANAKNDGIETVVFVSREKSKSFEQGVHDGIILSDCVCTARRLGDRPGNQMTPTMLAQETVRAADKTKLKVTVWDKAKIKAEKMNSFLSVALGSSQEPKFIVMEYNGAAKSKKPVCFVGKGLTFDSGGISLKPSAGMEEMKYDMGGGAAVIGAMLAIAKLGLKINAIGLVPATENMPGPSANKPGDIVIARNGKSIEINNTDAEGRLILNDALDYACELEPAAIFDAATLTGAMVVALGNLHTGFFTRHEKLAEKIQKAAASSGEWIWRMPLTDFHGKDMKGTYADLSNISSAKGAGSATAAAFLEQFVDPSIPWAHFDVAGTAWNSGDRWPYNPKKGATGVMVRTFVELAQLVG